MNLPSKELLSEVIGKEISAVKLSQFDAVGIKSFDCVTYSFEDNYGFDDIIRSINIYELAHKCKEWALNKELYFHISRNTSKYNKTLYVEIYDESGNPVYSKDWVDESEPEAIFKACQWILENK